MSMLDGLASTLAEMSFVQLALVFLAVGAYSMAINGALGGSLRSGAASASFVAGVAFAALAPSWVSGVVFLAVAVLAVAGFAAAAWALSMMLGLGSERGAMVEVSEVESAPAWAAWPDAIRALARSAIRLPL